MARKTKMIQVTMTIEEAINAALGHVEDVTNGLQESVDAVEGTNFENTERYQNWAEVASTLEDLDFTDDLPTVTEKVTFTRRETPEKGLSKVAEYRNQLSEAVENLSAVIAVLENVEEVEDGTLDDVIESLQDLIDTIESVDL